MTVDWEAEGMLEGLDARARAGRVELLDLLHRAGASQEELKQAIAEDRLALLPVERALAGDPHYTTAEVAELVGVDEPFLLELSDAFGLPVPAPEEVIFGQNDLDAARAVALFRQAGLPEGGLLELARILGDAMVPVAEGIRRLVGEVFLHAGDTERELGVRYEHAAVELMPRMSSLPAYVLNIQMRELVRRDAVGAAERASGHLPGTIRTAVAFADLIDFTGVGERTSSEELARMATRLSRMGRQAAKPPVRFVKTIGDAVMLVSPKASPLVGAVLGLVDQVEAQEDLPSLRAGVAVGEAINRWGDWYGTPVNIASRVTDRARPGSVLATREVREEAGEDYSWSRAGSHNFKNVSHRVSLHRARFQGMRTHTGQGSQPVEANAARG